MNQEQFKTFMGQIDRSLSEISSELNRADNPTVFTQALIRRVRQGFMEITKQMTYRPEADPLGRIEPNPSAVDLFYQNEEEVEEMFN